MQINGKNIYLEKPMSISDLLVQEGYSIDRVAVEKNKNIVPRGNYTTEIVTDDDVLEIVHFVGGG